MKKLIASAVLVVALVGLSSNAQTSSVSTNAITAPAITLTDTNADSGKTSGGWELTLGGGGTTIDGKSELGVDFSLSTNPFKKLPSIWVGVAQGVYWEPKFAGSTDVFVDWSWNIYNETLYLNTGWSVGSVYGQESTVWRTGPELTLQYYTSDNAFIYAGVNYDFVSKGDDGIRWCLGVGLSF